MKNSKAFTLIEILFVIAILGIIFSLGMIMLQRHTQQLKAEKTALQIQQLLQAGMTYYVDNNCWPRKGGTPQDCSTKPPPNFSGYIPIGSTKNPWGYDYNWKTTGTSNTLFEVSVNTPKDTIAQRVVAALPRGTRGDDSDPNCKSNCVKVQTTIPAFQVRRSPINIVKIGTLTFKFTGKNGATATIDQPSCPAYANEKFISLIPRGFQVLDPSGAHSTPYFNNSMSLNYVIKSNVCPDNKICVTYQTNGTYCNTTIRHKGGRAYNIQEVTCHTDNPPMLNIAEVDYIIYCCQPGFCHTNQIGYPTKYIPPTRKNTITTSFQPETGD